MPSQIKTLRLPTIFDWKANGDMKRKQRVSVVELRGTEEEKAIIRKAKERDGRRLDGKEDEDDQSADGIANGISTFVSRYHLDAP